MTTRMLIATFRTQGGEPLAGARVTFNSTPLRAFEGLVVVPEPVTVVTSVDGAVAVSLVPGDYSVTVATGKASRRGSFCLPPGEGAVALADLLPA